MKLIADKVSKKIKGKPILVDICLEMDSGNVYGFWGRNGSGKTMLFRALSGLMRIDSGGVYWNGQELHKDFSVLPSLGIVLEHAGLYPSLTGMENLMYLAEELPSVSEVVRVTSLQGVEHLAGTSRQLVRVDEVYQGTALEEGEEIYVTFYRWSLSLSDEPFSIERGFVNVMETEEAYLLFLEGQADGLGEQTPVYRLYGESVIAPVFFYKEHDNRSADMVLGSTYVLYRQVRENEFFGVSQAALDALAELKRKMLERYSFSA